MGNAVLKQQYITNSNGEKVAVVLDLKLFEKLLEDLEELEDIRSFDTGLKERKKAIPLDKAISKIRKKRN